MSDPAPHSRLGLCGSCIEAERTGNRRGSEFILCALSRTDHRFPRYPRLPVLHCNGYRPRGGHKADDE